jgi:hypothetical protein
MRPRSSDQNYKYAALCIGYIVVMYTAEEKYTSIRLKTSTVGQLKALGRKGESYDDVVSWLLRNSKKRKISNIEPRPKRATDGSAAERLSTAEDIGKEWHP